MNRFLQRHGAKIAVILIVLIVACCTKALNSQDIPQRPPFPQRLVDRAPFSDAPAFAKHLYIENVARLSNDYLATVASTVDPAFKEYISAVESANGYVITSVLWSEEKCETKVVVCKDGQLAVLGFLSTCGVIFRTDSAPSPLWPLRFFPRDDP